MEPCEIPSPLDDYYRHEEQRYKEERFTPPSNDRVEWGQRNGRGSEVDQEKSRKA